MKSVLLVDFENFNFQLGTNSFCSDSMKYYTSKNGMLCNTFACCTNLLYKCANDRIYYYYYLFRLYYYSCEEIITSSVRRQFLQPFTVKVCLHVQTSSTACGHPSEFNELYQFRLINSNPLTNSLCFVNFSIVKVSLQSEEVE